MRRAGFSLLEILLVLVLMVGILAIVWPAIGRSLASTDLRESGSLLRDALADARRLALESGEPVLLRIEPDGRTLRFDRWHRIVDRPDRNRAPLTDGSNFGSDDASAGQSVESAAASEAEFDDERIDAVRRSDLGANGNAASTVPPPRRLGADVRIITVRTPNESIAPTIDPLDRSFVGPEIGGDPNRDVTNERSAASFADRTASDRLPGETNEFGSSGENELPEPAAGWIWFLPHGQTPATEFVLFDPNSRRELTVSIDGWTGAIEIGPDRRRADPMVGKEASFGDSEPTPTTSSGASTARTGAVR
ncbi:MAG TPA: hypothetical protein PLI18_01195 [Pirellulaceae bacterium]|nr:hypothetical protein [Pirellulaceae bacterium]